ncbi:MAG TPA: type II toxin-antitoxin system HicA family toxin [Actinomycetota bacterium]|nr:type II toxin-antitoxin system HicA family toxin [Actinomycetota bacterium]
MSRRKRYTQKALVRELSRHGWTKTTGGKHQVKMVRAGERPITIPEFRGETLPIGLSEAILRQAGIEGENIG